jgi:hypothetical protein
MSFKITVAGNRITRDIVIQHLKALAETFSQKWSYDKARVNVEEDVFLRIQGTCEVPPVLVKKFHCGNERIVICTAGELLQDHTDQAAGIRGFSARASVRTNFIDSGNYDENYDDWEYDQDYPCDHVPVPDDW